MSKLKKGILAAFDHVTECMMPIIFFWRAAS